MNAQIDGGREPPDDGNLALRMRHVESGLASVKAELVSVNAELASVKTELASVKTELASVKTDVAIIKSNYATKEDMHREMVAQTWRLVTFVCALNTMMVGAIYVIASSMA